MPNWCLTEVAFVAARENVNELQRLHEVLSRLLETKSTIKNDFGNGWLGNVAIAHGLDTNGIPCRGWIDSIDDINDEKTSFIIYTTTAWAPTTELWDAVCQHYPGVSYLYCAEEGGNGVYVNTDRSGEYLDKRFAIDCICNGLSNPLPSKYFLPGVEPEEVFGDETYFPSFSELQSYMEEITGKSFHTLEQIEEYLNAALVAYSGDEHICCTVHEFAYQ